MLYKTSARFRILMCHYWAIVDSLPLAPFSICPFFNGYRKTCQIQRSLVYHAKKMKSSFFDEKHIKFVWKICKIDTISKASIAWKTEKNARIHYEEKKEEDRNGASDNIRPGCYRRCRWNCFNKKRNTWKFYSSKQRNDDGSWGKLSVKIGEESGSRKLRVKDKQGKIPL